MMKKFFKRFHRETGDFTFIFIALLYVVTIACILIGTLAATGCGQATAAKEPADAAPTNEAPTGDKDEFTLPDAQRRSQNFTVTITPGDGTEGRGFYAAEDLGSHVMYVTEPRVDGDLQGLMDEYNISAVEVYFRRDEGNQLPEYLGEPEASAVYYFYSSDAEQITLSFKSYGSEAPLIAGVHLDDPGYVMKYSVACPVEGDVSEISSMLIEDYSGGQVLFDHVAEATFTIDTLHIDAETLANAL